jgi:hypothetical protein
LDRAQTFTEVVFLGVAIEWLLGVHDVWLIEVEYRLKKDITFDPIVVSRSNFYNGLQRQFFLW